MKLIAILTHGQIEKIYPKTIQGRNDAIYFLRQLAKKNCLISHKFIDLAKGELK